MIAMIRLVGLQIVYISAISAALLYIGLVILGYATEGPHYQVKFDLADPIRSMERLLVGIGVRVLAATLHVAGVIFDPLFEASAEIGEWFTKLGSAETQARYRSRFI
jgi:hypothetical protein